MQGEPYTSSQSDNVHVQGRHALPKKSKHHPLREGGYQNKKLTKRCRATALQRLVAIRSRSSDGNNMVGISKVIGGSIRRIWLIRGTPLECGGPTPLC